MKTTQTFTSDDSLSWYFDEVGRYPLLSRAEELRLARLAAAGDENAKTRLVESNLRLVVAIARRYRGLGLDLLDLIQEGNLGLMAAVDKYDSKRDVKFGTYAAWWIRRAITRSLSTKSRLIRLPIRLAEHSSRVNRSEAELAQQLGRRPSADEVARHAGVPEAIVSDLRRANQNVVSLSQPVGDDDMPLGDFVGLDAELDPALQFEDADEQASVVDAFAALGDRSRRVLELRFGVDGIEPQTLDDVAGELGLSRERVRKLEAKALQELSEHPQLNAMRAAA